MNLFIVSRNLPEQHHMAVISKLRRMVEIYPRLDPTTLWNHATPYGNIFLASMHVSSLVAAPRRYVSIKNGQVVFYTGLPINQKNTFSAFDAEALSKNWDQVTESLEGQYFIVRATDDPPSLELQTDILGYEQVYYYNQGDLWLISNSVLLIEQIIGPQEIDPLGVSLFLSAGWVGADRTLRSNIKVIPHGQHWTWRNSYTDFKQESYYPPTRLSYQPRKSPTNKSIKKLSRELTESLRSICEHFDNVKCSLTGGRDSRLIAALMISAGLNAEYYTFGDPSGSDVIIAKKIAETYKLPYKIDTIIASDVIREWDDAYWQSIRQTDGMRSIYLITGILKDSDLKNDQKNVILWGAGGEIARCFYGRPNFFLHKQNTESIQNLLFKKRAKNFDSLLRQPSIKLVKDYISSYIEHCLEDGFSHIDIPDVFGMYQGDSRRIGNNSRGLSSVRDVFSPFCTRAFVEMTFATPALKRYTESLHYKLMRVLAPELHRLPFDKKPWPLQHSIMNLIIPFIIKKIKGSIYKIPKIINSAKPTKAYKPPTTFDRITWFEAKRGKMREICLDQNTSMLWAFIERAKFEQMMSSEINPTARSRYLKVLCHIVTLFSYEADSHRPTSPIIK